MSDQPTSKNNSNPNNNRPAGNNNQRRHNNQRNRPQGATARTDVGAPSNPNRPTNNSGPSEGSAPRRRHGRNHNNRSRNPQENAQRSAEGNRPQHPNQGPQGSSSEKIYEKYLNLLDQHLIARRKYHDLFYRADPGQKNKLERNFYNTLNDIRDFESRLPPGARELFEKRNNGLKPDNIYTTNHELPLIGENPPPVSEWADPHYLQTQRNTDYAKDKEESIGTAEDYLLYKNLL